MSDKQKANKLDGKEWLRNSVSVWSDIRKTREERQLGHPAMFPVELAGRLMDCFMKPEDHFVIDPFAGVGSTMVAAKERGYTGVGTEISPEYVQIAEQRLTQVLPFNGNFDARIFCVDNRKIREAIPVETKFDFCVTSPPYWRVLSRKRTADNRPVHDYTGGDNDLSRIDNYQDFLVELAKSFKALFGVLRRGAYCCVVVKDLHEGSLYYPFHIDVCDFMRRIGYTLCDTIIWDRGSDYNSLAPLGYPYRFHVNTVHEYVLVFKTP